MESNGQKIRRPDGFKRVRRRDNQTTRGYVRALKRNVEHLQQQLDAPGSKDHENRVRQDVAALQFALRCCREWIDADPLVDVVWEGPAAEKRSLQDLVSSLGGWLQVQGAAWVQSAGELVGVRLIGRDPARVRLTVRPLSPDEQPTFPTVRLLLPAQGVRMATEEEVRG